jgi:hypothetical protein
MEDRRAAVATIKRKARPSVINVTAGGIAALLGVPKLPHSALSLTFSLQFHSLRAFSLITCVFQGFVAYLEP